MIFVSVESEGQVTVNEIFGIGDPFALNCCDDAFM
jgi:hypothetical protein